jgi:succinylglutamate desuccinylase
MAKTDCFEQAHVLEDAIHTELGDPRFIPYLQVHEFEALVLAVPERFADWFEDRQRALANLAAECHPYDTSERINHGQHSHPKARIEKHFNDYAENVHGPLLAHSIGLQTLRGRCPHFGQWLTRLEQLDQTTP